MLNADSRIEMKNKLFFTNCYCVFKIKHRLDVIVIKMAINFVFIQIVNGIARINVDICYKYLNI